MGSSTFVTPAEGVISNARAAVSGTTSTLRYPEEVGSHTMIFSFKSYNASQNGTAGTSSATSMKGAICLPLPRVLQDSTAPDVMQEKLGATGSITRDVYGAIQNGANLESMGSDFAQGVINGISNANMNSVTGMGLFAARNGLSVVSPAIEQGLGVASGLAVNPHQALVFNGVALKTFDFDWTLIPNNEAEATAIRNIINRFKKASLPAYQPVTGSISGTPNVIDTPAGPQVTSSGSIRNSGTLARGLLRYPDMVDIFFTGLDPEYFPKFKTAMITRVQVDYTPQSGMVLNKGSAGSKPAIVHLTVSIIEAQIHTSDDYTDTWSSTGGH
jgi:hypothetical protein